MNAEFADKPVAYRCRNLGLQPRRIAWVGPGRVNGRDARLRGGNEQRRARGGDRRGIDAIGVSRRDAEVGREILRPEQECPQAGCDAAIIQAT